MMVKNDSCKQNCVITGSNSGIGLETAIELAKRGYEIIMIVRKSKKSELALNRIINESGSKCITVFYTDLASLNSINKTAAEIKKQFSSIDILINNAGLFSKKYGQTIDGFEKMMAVNYLAVFTLTYLLLPVMNKKSGRIINLSSELFKGGQIQKDSVFETKKFKGEQVYANSKLLVNYFTHELSKRLKNENIVVSSVHPGVVGTNIFREYPKWFNALLNLFIAKPRTGAKPVVKLATMPAEKSTSGTYYNKFKPVTSYRYDEQLSEHIWNTSAQIAEKKQNHENEY